MIAHLKITKGMSEPPNACCICGGNGTNSKGGQADAIYAPGVDIDWGGSLYICMECADVIADLICRSTREGFDKLQAKNKVLEDQVKQMTVLIEHQGELIAKVREGAKAQKTLRKVA